MRAESEPIEGEFVAPYSQRGTNQAGMRAHNERLVLTLVRRRGPLAKSEIARLTGLSAQTVSVIMRKLESDRLLRRGEPQRGRVGQPSVPLALDPEGAFFLGAKVGRRSLDVALVDFVGKIRWRRSTPVAWPTPADSVRGILAGVAEAARSLGPNAERIAGLGVAMPFALWSWAEEIDAPAAEMDVWRDADIRGDLAARLPWPVYVQNDATAACGAELVFGAGSDLQDFLYLYVGAFVGGGLVLNGGLFSGRTGNAAALGSMPAPGPDGRTLQLIDVASLVVLERRLRAAGVSPDSLYAPDADWRRFEPQASTWLGEAARALAHAVASACAVLDLEAVLIDGAFPEPIKARMLAAVAEELGRLDLSGVEPPQLRPGGLGPISRALGGASLPLFDRYLLDQHALAFQPWLDAGR